MTDIKSKAGRSRDVRRMYHRDNRNDSGRPSMRVWARAVVAHKAGTAEQVELVGAWLVNKGVEVYA